MREGREGMGREKAEKRKNKAERVVHEFGPLFDKDSRILVLGTIPSPKSREQGFYYGHPRNRFWKVVSGVFGEEEPLTAEARKAFALRNHMALWDVLASCLIQGAEDGSIRDPVANDMDVVLKHADIQAVFTTGAKAAALYRKYCEPVCRRPCIALPSTSPANCRMTEERLSECYRILAEKAAGRGAG